MPAPSDERKQDPTVTVQKSTSPLPGEPLIVLGIETSCDETAAAVVVREGEAKGRILSNIVRSQLEEHRPYGGVVPAFTLSTFG